MSTDDTRANIVQSGNAMVGEGTRLPTVFIPHGGGPCFFMEWTMGPPDTWDRLRDFLLGMDALLPARPIAVLVLSAHYETDTVTLTGGDQPELIYDYGGFPAHTYQLAYPAPGSPELARRAAELLAGAGIPTRIDEHRGFDHGVFVPMKVMYPAAELPIVQLSLRADLDPVFHLGVGRALEPLRDEGILILGSGLSYHNMRDFMSGRGAANSERFDRWLVETCSAEPPECRAGLAAWARAPAARAAHPREEHLLPLLVCAGAGGSDRGAMVFTDVAMNARMSAFAFGDVAEGIDAQTAPDTD